MVSRRLRAGEESADVATGTVQRNGPAIRTGRHSGHLYQRRFRASRSDRGWLRHAACAGIRPQARNPARPPAIEHCAGGRQALVRPATPYRPRPPCRGDRRRPGRLRHGCRAGRPWLAGQRSGAPCRRRAGGLRQSAGGALPQAVGSRHRAVEAGGRWLQLYPPTARPPAAGPGLASLWCAAADLRRQGTPTPG